MTKSNPQSPQEPSLSVGEASRALSLALSSVDAASASPPSSEPPQQLSDTQSIGTLTFPRLAWTSAWTPDQETLLIRLGGDLVRVTARGRWDSPEPKDTAPKPLPEQEPNETGQAYFFRALKYYRTPANRYAPQYRQWLATRQWVGEASSDLLAALREGRDLPGRKWAFINERPSTLD